MHGFCSHSRFSILIYKYLEKGNLASILSNDGGAKELDWNKRVNIVKGVAHALSYIHHDCLPPIVHRDISSKNILLSSEYEAHVSNFGIAKILNQDLSNWTSLAGTYGYLAPDIFPPISGYHSRHPNSLRSSREANADARYTPPTMHTCSLRRKKIAQQLTLWVGPNQLTSTKWPCRISPFFSLYR